MRLSTKSRYGLRAMVDLAAHCRYGPVAVGDISQRQALSAHYLEQLLNTLRKAQIVRSLRGPKGGYVLAKDADKITVGDIIEILEGGIAPVDCARGQSRKKMCSRAARCVTKLVWDALAARMNEALHGITLAELVEREKELQGGRSPKHGYMFHI